MNALVKNIIAAAILILLAAPAYAERPAEGWLPRGAIVGLGVDGGNNPYCLGTSEDRGIAYARIPLYRAGRQSIVLNGDYKECLGISSERQSGFVGLRYNIRIW